MSWRVHAHRTQHRTHSAHAAHVMHAHTWYHGNPEQDTDSLSNLVLMSLLSEADAVLRSYPVFLRVPWLTREGMRGYLHVEMYMQPA